LYPRAASLGAAPFVFKGARIDVMSVGLSPVAICLLSIRKGDQVQSCAFAMSESISTSAVENG
jgi:hypothetical protein